MIEFDCTREDAPASTRVNLLSRYGTRDAPLLSASMTLPSVVKLLLMALDSASRSRSLPVSLLFSLPARSIRLILPVQTGRRADAECQ